MGSRRHLARRDPLPADALDPLLAADHRGGHRHADAPHVRRHGGARHAAAQSAQHRRGRRDDRPPERRPLRVRHRPQRLAALVQRARRAVRGEPGTSDGRARGHARGVERQAVQLPRHVLHRRQRGGPPRAAPAAASARADRRAQPALVRAQAAALGADGCSGVPDFYLDCCLAHDIAYRTGRDFRGNVSTRAEADAGFRRCMQSQSPFGVFSPMAWWRWVGVRLFGGRSWQGGR